MRKKGNEITNAFIRIFITPRDKFLLVEAQICSFHAEELSQFEEFQFSCCNNNGCTRMVMRVLRVFSVKLVNINT